MDAKLMLALISAVIAVAVAYPFNEQAFRMNNFERVSQQRHPPHMQEEEDCFCVEDPRGNRVCEPENCDFRRRAQVKFHTLEIVVWCCGLKCGIIHRV